MMADEYENLGGRQVKRSPDGKFEQAKLDPETASRMGKRRWARAGQALSDRVRRLLEDRDIDPDTADESMIALAEIGLSNRGGAVSALRYLDALTGHGVETGLETFESLGHYVVPKPGERCPRCGAYGQGTLNLSPKALEILSKYFQDDDDDEGEE